MNIREEMRENARQHGRKRKPENRTEKRRRPMKDRGEEVHEKARVGQRGQVQQ